jgi:energy-coupling factor transporter ATP-binding protein EcfA2
MDNNSPPLLSLIVRNKSFAAEIYSMGSGLQIWAQVIWFITVIKNSDIVIFDEPDIYLHADLQQKLIKLIKGAFSQIILTTHSVEIISNSAPSDILIIDKDNKKSNFAADIPTLQRLIQSFGSIQNINYSKYWTTKKIIFVEGDDFKYLKQFYKICFPNNQNTIETIPYIEIGGWGGWDKVKDIASILENSLGERVTAYCILDSDYHTQELIAKRKSEALSSNIHLHIWERKEIESYLLDPNTIYRVIINRSDFSKKPILVDITSFLQKTIDEEAETVLDGLATEIYNENRSKGVKNANEIARSIVSNYKMLGNLSLHVPAKTIISKISDWSTKKYNVSISPYALLNEIKKIEIAPEIINLLQQIVS